MGDTVAWIVFLIAAGVILWWGIGKFFEQETFDDQGDDMAKRHPQPPSYREDILLRFDQQDRILLHLVEHAHHLEELVKAVGTSTPDQAKLQAINDKLDASKAKLTAALAATPAPPGASPQS